MHNKLDNLYTQRKQLKDLIRYAKLYNGSISLNNEIITIAELKASLSEVNAEIAAIVSNSRLRLVK